MREIVFRGKREYNGDWVYGSFIPDLCEVHYGEYIDADSDFDYPCIGFYIKIPDGCCNIGALLTDGFEYEVIGNIHDNPELMGVNDG